MKKFITLLALFGALTVGASDFHFQSFLTKDCAKGLRLDDGTADGVTNLAFFAHVAAISAASNQVGIIITNSTGQGIAVAASSTTNGYEAVDLLGSVMLFPDALGKWTEPTYRQNYTWSVAAFPSNYFGEIPSTNFNTPCTLVVEYRGYSAIDAAVNIGFVPGYRDETLGRDVLVTNGTVWNVTFTPATLTGVNQYTCPVPIHRWPGFERLYCLYMENADDTAGDEVCITRCDMIGWRP